MTRLSLNTQQTLGLSVPQLPIAANGMSVFPNTVFQAVVNPARSTFTEAGRMCGREDVQAWQVSNQLGSAIVVPDRLGPSRDIFRQLPQPILREHMDAFLMRLLWFDRESWNDIADGSSNVAGAYSTVHYLGLIKDIVPPLYAHVVENPGAMNVFNNTPCGVCDDLEAELYRHEIASVAKPAVRTAKIVRPDDGGATRVKIIEGESLGIPVAGLGDAHIDFHYVKKMTTRYGGKNRKDMREEMHIIRSAQYLRKQLTWKRAFTIFRIDDQELIFMAVPKDGDINSSHGTMRHGLRVLLGADDVNLMLRYQGRYGYIEYGIQDNEDKVVVVLNSLCGTRIYDGCIADRLMGDASEVMRVFGNLSTPKLPVEVVLSKDRKKPQRMFGPR